MWYLQNIFISLFFVCAAWNPTDVTSDSAADIEFKSRDEGVNFDTKMKELQTEMKDLLKQEEKSRKELLNLFKELGYGLEWQNCNLPYCRWADRRGCQDGDSVWLSQAQMAELFQKDRTVIGRHISNIYKEHELERETTCANFAHTKNYGRREGFTQTKNIVLYNLDVIISVGYRVKSQRGTQFRIWANKVLKEYLIKGYAVNKALTEQRYTELKQLVNVLGRV